MLNALKTFYRVYLKRVPLIRELVFSAKTFWRYQCGYYPKYQDPTWRREASGIKEGALKLAVICDDLTWANISGGFQAVYLTAHNWRAVLEEERPDVLFCEATWEGLDGSWKNEIFRNREFAKDNRSVLKDILKYCRNACIPTIFWNKEDTPKFEDNPYSFIETALLFDHVFTTAAECVPKYRAAGHKSVHLMMFGFSPELFCVLQARPRKGIAVFLGSWYAANQERCRDMCQMFDMVLSQGLELRIYDRVSQNGLPDRKYPERYSDYIFPAVPYRKTGEIMNQADYVININSVKDSETMFARRVFEAMACGRIVISNESCGLRKLFPERIWFAGQDFDWAKEEEIAADNLETVHKHYTFRKQMVSALYAAGILDH